MRYEFLVETYETERVKVVSVWSEFHDEDLPVRPRADDPRGRSVAEDSGKRLEVLRGKPESWFEEETKFFDVARSRAWVLTRRLTHTSHHRGQQMAMLRMLRHDLHSNYGPTADTGGLMQNHAPTIYAYDGLEALLKGEARGGGNNIQGGHLTC